MTPETSIETILEQHGIGGMEGLSTASILSHLYLGESEMKHNASRCPRDEAHYRREAARYADAARAINELKTAA